MKTYFPNGYVSTLKLLFRDPRADTSSIGSPTRQLLDAANVAGDASRPQALLLAERQGVVHHVAFCRGRVYVLDRGGPTRRLRPCLQLLPPSPSLLT